MNEIRKLSCVLAYELKQQTPIIHFQHNQNGATLRATEVKPKLDKFIIQKLGGLKAVDKCWFISDTEALNYKMQISATGAVQTVELGFKTPYDIFYGNMGTQEHKKGVLCDSTVKIICIISELREVIDKYISEFFIITNFGTMQNKGFGSYVIKNKPCTPWAISQYLKENYGAEKCYMFRGGREPFKAIKTVYGLMKTGINFRNYQRSLLFLYMHNEYAMSNEKAWLKQHRLAPSDVGKNAHLGDRNASDHKAYYVRALLGIGDHIDFINDLNDKKNKTNVKIVSENKVIERFHSPILFKVIDGNVYYVARRIDDIIYGAKFKFTSQKGSGTLTVPTKEQLGSDFIDDFLEYCKDELNNVALEKFDDTKHLKIQEV